MGPVPIAGEHGRAAAGWAEGLDQTHQYLIGELSVRLGDLQAATRKTAAGDVARLRRQVGSGPLAALSRATARALALADSLCWESLTRGDTAAFARQSAVSADLRLFGACAGLLTEEWAHTPGRSRSQAARPAPDRRRAGFGVTAGWWRG